MAIDNLTLDPDVSDLISTAFDKSWRFVRTDPELAHNDMNEMRVRLSRHITRLAGHFPTGSTVWPESCRGWPDLCEHTLCAEIFWRN